AEQAEQLRGRRGIDHLAGPVVIPHGHPGPAFGWVPGASPPGVWAGRTASTRQRVEAALPTQTGVPMLSARWMVRLCVLGAALPSLRKNYFTRSYRYIVVGPRGRSSALGVDRDGSAVPIGLHKEPDQVKVRVPPSDPPWAGPMKGPA